MKKFNLISNFTGYTTKPDQTNTSSRSLVVGSQNVLINDAEKVKGRTGYTLFGATNSALTPILSSFDWMTSSGLERNLRFYNGILEWYDILQTTPLYSTLIASLSTTRPVRFTTAWSSTEKIDLLYFVNHSSILYEWSGGTTTFSSATATTVTKQGSDTFAQVRFLTSGTRGFTVLDSGGTARAFTYTGGEGTTTLIGVSPDPTAFTFTVGATIFQTVRQNTNVPSSLFTNDLIDSLNNQLYVGSETSREVYVSSATSITSYSFSTPRVPGEGALLTLDNATVGFVSQDEDMYIAAGKDDWFRTQFTLSGGSTTDREVLSLKKLKTGPGQAAQSQELIAKIKNRVVFVNNEPALVELGDIENVRTPQQSPLSDPIKPDFDAATFTSGNIKYFKNQIFISVPSDGNIFIYDIDKGYWQPPQILPVAKFAIIGGSLYGHSSAVPETYKLFTGTNDNNNVIAYKAKFAYRNFGDRVRLKNFDEYYTELYISSNTVLTMRLFYDYKGATSLQEFDIRGDDDTILFTPVEDASLGINPLGTQPLGGLLDAPELLAKARQIDTTVPIDFFELQTSYETDVIDAQFEILAHGPAARVTPVEPIFIKK